MADYTKENDTWLAAHRLSGALNGLYGSVKELQDTPPGSADFSTIAGLPSDCTPLQSELDAKLTKGTSTAAQIDSHLGSTANPHSVTKAQVGLTNVNDVQQMPLSYLDTDDAMTANSDVKVPSQNAVRAYVAAHAGGGGGVIYGAYADRPAAGTDGRLYVPTDGYELSIDNGVSWDTYVDGFKCTSPPAAASLTAVNEAAVVTLTDDGDGLLMTQIGSASTSERNCHYLTAVPAAPYTFAVILEPLYIKPTSWTQIGIVLADGTDIAASKTVHFTMAFGSAGFPMLSASYQTNGTTGGVYLEQIHHCTPLLQKYVWFRFRDDNTDRFFEFSGDGRNWEPYFSHGRTTHITPTYIGLTVEQGTTSVAATIVRSRHRIVHWSLA